MVDSNKGMFTNQNNDSDILLNLVMKKDYVYIRDKPALDFAVSFVFNKNFCFLH
jgi:hypothetical protein